MSFGGFLGMGEEEHAVPWSKLTYDTTSAAIGPTSRKISCAVRLRSLEIGTGTGATAVESKSYMTTIGRPTTGTSECRPADL